MVNFRCICSIAVTRVFQISPNFLKVAKNVAQNSFFYQPNSIIILLLTEDKTSKCLYLLHDSKGLSDRGMNQQQSTFYESRVKHV